MKQSRFTEERIIATAGARNRLEDRGRLSQARDQQRAQEEACDSRAHRMLRRTDGYAACRHGCLALRRASTKSGGEVCYAE